MSALRIIAGHLLRLWRYLTLAGRIRAARPLALLPGPLLLLVALLLPARWIFFVAYAELLLAAGAYLWVRALGAGVVLRRSWSGAWLQAGDLVEERWELVNSGMLPLLWLEVEDASTLPGYTSRWVTAAGAYERRQWRTDVVCRRRGIYSLGPLRARLGDPFGLFYYEWVEPGAYQLAVYPPLLALPALNVPEGQRGGLMRAQLMQLQATPSVGGLRAYQPGDPLSHVHWPHLAKTQQLMVKEFDQERAGAFWIVLDAQASAVVQLSSAADPAEDVTYAYRQSSLVEVAPAALDLGSPLELSIALACSLAAQALAEGRAVGLITSDGRQRLVVPGRGQQQLWRILAALVDIQAGGAPPLDEVLLQGRSASTAGGADSLAIITAAQEGAWLPALSQWRRGQRGGALALLVAERVAEMGPLALRLAALGIAVQNFELGSPLPLLNPPRPRAVRRVSPLGKVM